MLSETDSNELTFYVRISHNQDNNENTYKSLSIVNFDVFSGTSVILILK